MPILGIIASPLKEPVVPVTANLKFYYDASDATTLTMNGSRVSAIANKSPASPSQTLSQATSGNQPLLVDNVYNGRSILRLTAARGDNLYINSTTLTGNAHTTFVVAKVTSATNGYKFFFGNDTNYQMPLFYQLSSKTYYETSTGTSAVTSTVTSQNELHIQMVRHQNTTVRMRTIFTGQDETKNVTGGGNLNVTSANTGIARGGAAADFDFCETVAYESSLSDGDVDLVIAYLKDKWGIS